MLLPILVLLRAERCVVWVLVRPVLSRTSGFCSGDVVSAALPNTAHLKPGIKIKGLLYQVLGQYRGWQAIGQQLTLADHQQAVQVAGQDQVMQ